MRSATISTNSTSGRRIRNFKSLLEGESSRKARRERQESPEPLVSSRQVYRVALERIGLTATSQQRKKTLLPLLDGRTHTSTFVDRRFGENSATLTLEEKALERFTAERTSRLGGTKKARFNLEDGDEPADAGADLTHGGRKLGFGDEDELDAGGWGGLGDGGIVNSNHEPLLRRRMMAEAEAEDVRSVSLVH